MEHDVDLVGPLPAVTSSPSSPLQKCVQCVEALKTTTQNFVIGHSFFCPALEDAINANTFDSLEFRVVQIGVVDHFADFCDGFIRDGKTLRESLKRAAIAMMREFGVQHVEGNRFRHGLSSWCKNEFCFGVDELGNQPRRSHSIDLRPRTSQPGFFAILLRIERLKLRRALRSLRATKQHRHFMSARTIEEIDLAKIAELFSQSLELGSCEISIRFAAAP